MTASRQKLAALYMRLSLTYSELARELDPSVKTRAIQPITEAELDGKYGRPKVRCDPRAWGGESFKGRMVDQCPAEFLDLYAAVLDQFADESDDPTKEQYNRRDAARVRAWADRKRRGWIQASTGAMPSTTMPENAMPAESEKW